jgi:hypothetical protein
MPAADAKGWFVATMPLRPWAGCFSHLKIVPVRWRQLESLIELTLFVVTCEKSRQCVAAAFPA